MPLGRHSSERPANQHNLLHICHYACAAIQRLALCQAKCNTFALSSKEESSAERHQAVMQFLTLDNQDIHALLKVIYGSLRCLCVHHKLCQA